MPVELPDEAIAYHYQSLLAPVAEDWSAADELRAQHFLAVGRLKELLPRLMQVTKMAASWFASSSKCPKRSLEIIPLSINNSSQ